MEIFQFDIHPFKIWVRVSKKKKKEKTEGEKAYQFKLSEF
jgi:hypothetical protein